MVCRRPKAEVGGVSETTRTHATMVALQVAELQTKAMSPSDFLTFCAQVDDFITGIEITERRLKPKPRLHVVGDECAADQ